MSTEPDPNGFFGRLLDAVPAWLMVVDEDLRIFYLNAAARQVFTGIDAAELRTRSGELLRCINASRNEGVCGTGEECRHCCVRGAVGDAIQGEHVHRVKARMTLMRKSGAEERHLLITAAPFPHNGETLILLTLEDVSELVLLRRLLPVCASCKKIRNEENYWQTMEHYFNTHLDVDFTHSICEECLEKIYPEYRL